MQQGLSLAGAAKEIPRLTVLQDRGDMPPKRLPAPDLPPILFRQSATHVVPAVPLEPAPRVVLIDPAVLTPYGQGPAGIDPEIVEAPVSTFRRELGVFEPASRKLLLAVRHVLAAKHS